MFDLHIHTTASDGELNPEEIILEAKKNGVTKIAITDHDTVANVEECILQGKKNDVIVIPGVELSVEVPVGEMHILGYGIDINNSKFQAVMKFLRDGRAEKNLRIVKALNERGIDITLEEVKNQSKGESIGRPHFAKVMIEKGMVNSVQEAFSKYLKQDYIEEIKRVVLKPKAAIELINEVGGIAILAHPCSLKKSYDETYEIIKELKAYGLGGVEVYHSDNSPEQVQNYKKIAESEKLLITCGSDYHGKTVKPDIELGKGRNGNLIGVDDRTFEKLYKTLNEKAYKHI